MQDLIYNNGDVTIDDYGDLKICSTEDEDIIQTANNNIYLRYGHNKYHDDIGNKVYTKRIKMNESGIDDIKEECIDAILNGDDRVVEVTKIEITTGSDEDKYSYIVDYGVSYLVSVDDSYEDDEDDDIDSGDYDEDDDVYGDYNEDEEDTYDLDDSDISEDNGDQEDDEETREVFGRAFII